MPISQSSVPSPATHISASLAGSTHSPCGTSSICLHLPFSTSGSEVPSRKRTFQKCLHLPVPPGLDFPKSRWGGRRMSTFLGDYDSGKIHHSLVGFFHRSRCNTVATARLSDQRKRMCSRLPCPHSKGSGWTGRLMLIETRQHMNQGL